MHERLHAWTYSLVYPAFLGTFIVALVAASAHHAFVLGVVLAIYFSLLHGEGVLAKRYESFLEWLGDVVEIALMALLFVRLGLLNPDGHPKDPAAIRPWLAAVFLVPVIVRWGLAWLGKRERQKTYFYTALTVASVGGAIAAACYPAPWTVIAIGALVASYGLFGLLLNDRLPAAFHRPQPAH